MEILCALPIAISAVLCALGVFFGSAVLLARFTRIHVALIASLSAAVTAVVYFVAYLVWKKPVADLVMGPTCWFVIMLPINALIVWGVRRLGESRSRIEP